MSQYLDYARRIRADEEKHYNCAQGVVIPFGVALGINEDLLYDVARNFGAGMKMAATCGAVTGGLMALGLYGVDDRQTVSQFYRAVKDQHQGCLDCADLLRINKETGTPKKVHCDGMVFECVDIVEKILREKGKID